MAPDSLRVKTGPVADVTQCILRKMGHLMLNWKSLFSGKASSGATSLISAATEERSPTSSLGSTAGSNGIMPTSSAGPSASSGGVTTSMSPGLSGAATGRPGITVKLLRKNGTTFWVTLEAARGIKLIRFITFKFAFEGSLTRKGSELENQTNPRPP